MGDMARLDARARARPRGAALRTVPCTSRECPDTSPCLPPIRDDSGGGAATPPPAGLTSPPRPHMRNRPLMRSIPPAVVLGASAQQPIRADAGAQPLTVSDGDHYRDPLPPVRQTAGKRPGRSGPYRVQMSRCGAYTILQDSRPDHAGRGASPVEAPWSQNAERTIRRS